MRFAFIAVEKAACPLRLLCRTLQVSRAGFYAWQGRPRAARAQADARLGLEIAAIQAESRQRYGSPRDSRRAGGARLPHGQEAGGAADAGPGVGRPAPAALPSDDALAASVSDCA